ncbi:hypothetical protein Cgig2_006771 [Carnegiea gigantea]|uniref:Uncharacterized protein n=1 Tax=Carnegiea gigantea TaxID=171969 RepID=A0A9Q1Q697_9CARY|nr:hypothetical protein Cgig2_006771 [Carnegiea gigantea]
MLSFYSVLVMIQCTPNMLHVECLFFRAIPLVFAHGFSSAWLMLIVVRLYKAKRAIHSSVWTGTGPKTRLDRTGPCIIGLVHDPVFFQFRSSVRSRSGPVDRWTGPVDRREEDDDRRSLWLSYTWVDLRSNSAKRSMKQQSAQQPINIGIRKRTGNKIAGENVSGPILSLHIEH